MTGFMRKKYGFKLLFVLVLLFVAGAEVVLLKENNPRALLAGGDGPETDAGHFSRQLEEAWKLSRLGNSPAAEKKFMNVIESSDSAPRQKIQALFGLGNLCQFLSPSQPREAERYFARIVTDFPQSEVVPWAMLRIAQLQDQAGPESIDKSRSLYRDILSGYPDSGACDEAALSLAGSYFRETNPEIVRVGVETLETYLARNPDNPLVTSMLFRLSYWYQEVERDYKAALPYAARLGEMKTCNPKRWAMVYWGLGQMWSLRFEDDAKALFWYEKILEECPRDYLTYPAQKKVLQMQQRIQNTDLQDD